MNREPVVVAIYELQLAHRANANHKNGRICNGTYEVLT